MEADNGRPGRFAILGVSQSTAVFQRQCSAISRMANHIVTAYISLSYRTASMFTTVRIDYPFQ